MKTIAERHAAYAAAKLSDDNFEYELDRQFGADAGDKRYIGRLHDDKTAAARELYRVACAKLHDAWDGAK